MTHTREPWQHVLGHDTHKVKRDASGRMLGPVTMDLEDYDRSCECVNACAGINPEAVPEMMEALRALVAADSCNYQRDTMRAEGLFDAARALLREIDG